MGNRGRSSTPATVELTKKGVKFTPWAYVHDPSVTDYGAEAAQALGVDPTRIFKTLLAEVDGALAVAVVPVAGKLDLKALAVAVGGKRAQMSDPKIAERKTGYVVGGISPLGQRTRIRTVIDASAQQFETIFVSGGRRGFDLELTPNDLAEATGAHFWEIGRD